MKRNIIKPRILPGFMELLPKEQQIFNDIVSKITRVYEDNGCLAIDMYFIHNFCSKIQLKILPCKHE